MTTTPEPSKPSRTVKELSSKIWNDIGTTDIVSADDIRTGAPFIAAINVNLREIIVEVIRSCAAEVSSSETASKHLLELADKVALRRFHLLTIDLKENTNG